MAALAARLLPTIRAVVHRRLRGVSLGGSDASDVVQDVWVALLKDDARQLRAWDPERGASLERYVWMVAERELWNLRQRTRATRRVGPTLEATSLETVADHRPDPEQALAAHERQRWLSEHIAELVPESRRELWRDLQCQNVTPAEAASRLGLSRQRMYNWLHKTRVLARQLLNSTE